VVSLKKYYPFLAEFLAYIESEIYESFNLRSSVQTLVVGLWGSEIPRGLAMPAWLGEAEKSVADPTTLRSKV